MSSLSFSRERVMQGKIRFSVIGLALSAWASVAAPAQSPDAPPPYRIVNGKVDDATFRGWRAYHNTCHACHGVDAVGTAVAPSLVERVKQLSPKQFTIKVITSYRIVLGAEEARGDALRERFAEEVLRRERGELTMPAWEYDVRVRPHVLDLYAYLRARADGALGPGKPARLPSSDIKDR
jgi:hypothetical protein